jgi:hypothetical protein
MAWPSILHVSSDSRACRKNFARVVLCSRPPVRFCGIRPSHIVEIVPWPRRGFEEHDRGAHTMVSREGRNERRAHRDREARSDEATT